MGEPRRSIVALLAALAVGVLAHCAWGAGDSLPFGSEEHYALSSGIGDVAIVDFDHDGWPDIAVADSMAIRLFRNDRVGGFVLHTDLPLGPLNTVEAADLDGDGAVDLVFSCPTPHPGRVGILLATDAGFASPAFYEAASPPIDVRIADVTGDGFLDVVVVGAASLSSWLGSGDGSFGTRRDTTLPLGFFGTPRMQVADVDIDGKADVVLCPGTTAPLEVLRGRGNGMFDIAIPFNDICPGSAATVQDLDADQRPDIVVSSIDVLQILWNDGTGKGLELSVRDTLKGSACIFPYEWYKAPSVVASDCDGDGIVDVLASEQFCCRTWINWFRGGGGRKFAAAAAPLLSRFDGPDPVLLRIAVDVDHDGAKDIVSLRWPQIGPTLSVLRHDTPELFRGFNRLPIPSTSSSIRLFTVRFEDSPRLAFVQELADRLVYWTFNDRGGVRSVDIHLVCQVAGVVDVDGDTRTELLVYRDGALELVKLDGGLPQILVSWPGEVLVAQGAFAQAGTVDLMVRNSTTHVFSLLQNDGLGHFARVRLNGIVSADFQPPSPFFEPGVGDVGGDTRDEFIARRQDNVGRPNDGRDTLVVYRATEPASFEQWQILPMSREYDFGGPIEVVDLYESGSPVIVALSGGDARPGIEILDPLFPTRENLRIRGHDMPNGLAIRDLSQDSLLDIAFVSQLFGYEGHLTAAMNRGLGTFELIDRKIDGDLAKGLITGNIDGDGVPDLLTTTLGPARSAVVALINRLPADPVIPVGVVDRPTQKRFAIERISPNPVHRTATLSLVGVTPGLLDFELFDVAGRRVHREELSGNRVGAFVKLVIPSSVSSGVYLLRVRQNENAATARFAVVR